MSRRQAVDEDKVKQLADRMMAVGVEDNDLREEVRSTVFGMIDQETLDEWERAIKAEVSGEISTEEYEEIQRNFYDQVVEPLHQELMTAILTEVGLRLADQS